MISIIGNESYRDETAPKSANPKIQQRREELNDLKDLALLTFHDKSNLTPLDTLFGEPESAESVAKHRSVF